MKRVLMIFAVLLLIGIIVESSFAIWFISENSNVFVPIKINELNASEKYQIFVPLTREAKAATASYSPYNKVPGRFDTLHNWYVLDADAFGSLSDSQLEDEIGRIEGVAFVGLFGETSINRLIIIRQKELCIVKKEYCKECLDTNFENKRKIPCESCGGRGYGVYEYSESEEKWIWGIDEDSSDCRDCSGTGWRACECCVYLQLPVVRAMVDKDYSAYYVKQNSLIEYLYIPSSISEIDAGMFFNMTALNTLEFQTALDKPLVIRRDAFSACSSLKTPISIPRNCVFYKDNKSTAFQGCID